ncbi:CDP-alcohol phosphatidyltransferase [Curtanaerobium respiraculi]|jgi:hypothetical protein|uniref:CDP-alcohol phosphatidyltransferase n=1 Tax=Curtanaerobium respiraculi TaxID=2949669 RepID=UPI0024B3BF37|nr:CDP-alcohol phosphatidyltransferase [Curtanaerobium respiraculi]
MGKRSEEALEINYEDLAMYLRVNHSVYMRVGDDLYYLTDANSHDWRAQCTAQLNEKGHYTDCSDLVPTVGEFLAIPFVDGKTIEDVFADATFYASYKPE